MPRTDVHRPSAINPADYRFVAFDYCRVVQADDRPPPDLSGCTWLQAERETIRQDMVTTGGDWSAHAHGGNCMVCGNANAIYTATFHHAPTNSYVRMGSDCSHHVEASLDHQAFMRFRNRVSSWLQRENRVPLAVAELERHGVRELGQFCGASEMLPTDDTQRTISDIVYRLMQYGSLTDRQWNYLRVLRDRWLTPTVATAHRPNRYPGQCTRCQRQVEANQGAITQVNGRWTVHHLDGQCPQEPTPAPAATVGELAGVNQLFDRAAQHLQRPAVVLDVPGQEPIRIWRNGDADRFPGTLSVVGETRNSAGRRPYRGRVMLDGTFLAAERLATFPEIRDALVARLREFAADPARVAGEYGRLHGRCCFCRLPLFDARSTAVGYGAICAGHYGLPWGDRPAEVAAPVASTTGLAANVVAEVRNNLIEAFAAATGQRVAWATEVNNTLQDAPRQLDMNFDANAEHARRANDGQECPACESYQISRDGEHRWRCRDCGVKWEQRS